MRLGIIGGGRAAWAFGSHLAADRLAAHRHRHATRRTPIAELLGSDLTELARSDLLLVAVSDRAIERSRRRSPRRARIIFHPSGAMPRCAAGSRCIR